MADIKELTKSEQEVYQFLTDEFLTIKKIAIRRKTSIQAVYKTIKQLIQKGLINKDLIKVENKASGFKPSFPMEHKIRLHAIEFNIKIIHRDYRYKQLIDKVNMIDIDGNTIRLFNDSLELYLNKSFYSNDVNNAFIEASDYLKRVLLQIEDKLKVIVLKSKIDNIKVVNSHYAEINNEMAKECEIKGDKIQVKADDGKVWLLVDNSFNLHELETIHPITSKQDMGEVVKPFFNDLRDNKPPILSEMYNLIYIQQNTIDTMSDITKANTEGINGMMQTLQIFERNIQSHTKAIQELAKGMKKFNHLLSEHQRKIGDFL